MGMLNRKEFAKHKTGDKVKPQTHTGSVGAKQEHREDVDINVIIKRFSATGQLPVNTQSLQPIFADVSAMGDFGSALRRMSAATEAFMELPADLRARFGNKAENLVSFLQDDKNYDEAVKLGLAVKKEVPKEPTPQKVVVVKDETTPSPKA